MVHLDAINKFTAEYERKHRISRRAFLLGTGAAIATALAGCGGLPAYTRTMTGSRAWEGHVGNTSLQAEVITYADRLGIQNLYWRVKLFAEVWPDDPARYRVQLAGDKYLRDYGSELYVETITENMDGALNGSISEEQDLVGKLNSLSPYNLVNISAPYQEATKAGSIGELTVWVLYDLAKDGGGVLRPK